MEQPQMNQTTVDGGGTNTVLIVIVIIIILVGGYFLFIKESVAPAPSEENGGINIDVTLPANSGEQPPAGEEAYY